MPMEGPLPIADKLVRPAELESRFQHALEAAKLEAMAEFAAGAGHEINNPLTVISGRAQLLLRDEPDPERRHALALISAQAMRVYEMIADMMLFARPPRPEFQQVELTRLIDGLLADLSPGCAAQETAIRRNGEPGPILVQADPVQLMVALRAMCQNSLEALQSGGHVEIALETGASHLPNVDATTEHRLAAAGTPARDDSSGPLSVAGDCEVRIQIRDDGPGMKPEECTHLFDPFYSARQAGRGLGLGLSKAWRIITNHGGRIEVESQPGRGATFTIVLGPAGPRE
jgi:signal transduction histidine kinase